MRSNAVARNTATTNLTARKLLFVYGVRFAALLGIGGGSVKLYFLRNGTEVRTVTYEIEERPKWAVPQ